MLKQFGSKELQEPFYSDYDSEDDGGDKNDIGTRKKIGLVNPSRTMTTLKTIDPNIEKPSTTSAIKNKFHIPQKERERGKTEM